MAAYWRTPLTLATARTRVLQRADLALDSGLTNGFVSTDELDFYITNRADELRSFIISLNQDLLREEQTVAIVAGTAEYTLSTDVYQILAARLVSGTERYPLRRYADDHIETTQRLSWTDGALPQYRFRFDPSASFAHKIKFDPPPNAACTVDVAFVRSIPSLTVSSDIMLPFPDHYVTGAAIDCLSKKKFDASNLEKRLALLNAQIERWARQPDRNPRFIRDLRSLEETGSNRDWW
jgi:hypothetical protein